MHWSRLVLGLIGLLTRESHRIHAHESVFPFLTLCGFQINFGKDKGVETFMPILERSALASIGNRPEGTMLEVRSNNPWHL
jgi:hypothetical protein